MNINKKLKLWNKKIDNEPKTKTMQKERPIFHERHEKNILQHDNARPHVASVIKTYLEEQNWEVLPHPTYSPDIASSDCPLFQAMIHVLAGWAALRFLYGWIASKHRVFFGRGIRMFPVRWAKVVASDGQYFE